MEAWLGWLVGMAKDGFVYERQYDTYPLAGDLPTSGSFFSIAYHKLGELEAKVVVDEPGISSTSAAPNLHVETNLESQTFFPRSRSPHSKAVLILSPIY
jgi:hypothetical protein